MIMGYCIQSKNKAVGYNYILTVAKNWAKEGILTAQQVEEKLCQAEQSSSALAAVLNALGIKRNAFIEEKEMYLKWKEGMGFEDDAILFVAQSMKRKGGCEKLNALLEKYFLNGKFSVAEIKHFIASQDEIFALAKQINRNLGVYYESLDSEIETYITPWLNMGFEAKALEDLASYAFKSSIRSLDGLNSLVQKLYKLGILTKSALDEYLAGIVKIDEQIKILLQNLNISRRVNAFDRESYKTWKTVWNMSDEVISYAAELAKDKLSPLQYMARLLASWHENNITTVSQAKNLTPVAASQPQQSKLKGRSYTKQDYQAMIQSIDEIEL